MWQKFTTASSWIFIVCISIISFKNDMISSIKLVFCESYAFHTYLTWKILKYFIESFLLKYYLYTALISSVQLVSFWQKQKTCVIHDPLQGTKDFIVEKSSFMSLHSQPLWVLKTYTAIADYSGLFHINRIIHIFF
jgi:hypothetical protein